MKHSESRSSESSVLDTCPACGMPDTVETTPDGARCRYCGQVWGRTRSGDLVIDMRRGRCEL